MKFDVQPIYGWGWSNGPHRFEVPGPFSMDALVRDKPGFKTATGRLHNPDHPLASMWVILSPFPTGNNPWDMAHVCGFPEEPAIPDDIKTLVESAPLTGFARVTVQTSN